MLGLFVSLGACLCSGNTWPLARHRLGLRHKYRMEGPGTPSQPPSRCPAVKITAVRTGTPSQRGQERPSPKMEILRQFQRNSVWDAR